MDGAVEAMRTMISEQIFERRDSLYGSEMLSTCVLTPELLNSAEAVSMA